MFPFFFTAEANDSTSNALFEARHGEGQDPELAAMNAAKSSPQ